MTTIVPPPTHTTFLELTSGTRLNLSLKHAHAEQADARARIVFSHTNDFCWVEYAFGLSFRAVLQSAHLGSATIVIATAEPLLEGKIPLGTELYWMECNCSPWIEESCWDVVSNVYLDAMLNCRGDVPALGDMPDTCPWIAGFLRPEARGLSAESQRSIQTVARILGVAAINHCLTEVARHTPGRDPEDDRRRP